jgi:hypothetical protein
MWSPKNHEAHSDVRFVIYNVWTLIKTTFIFFGARDWLFYLSWFKKKEFNFYLLFIIDMKASTFESPLTELLWLDCLIFKLQKLFRHLKKKILLKLWILTWRLWCWWAADFAVVSLCIRELKQGDSSSSSRSSK